MEKYDPLWQTLMGKPKEESSLLSVPQPTVFIAVSSGNNQDPFLNTVSS